MPIYKEITRPNSLKIAFWHITETEIELKRQLNMASFNLDEFNRIHVDEKRKQWLAARILIKHLLAVQCAVFYDEHRAPFLEDSTNNISISHSGSFVAVGINQDQRVGIDLQYFNPKILNIKEKFCSEDELNRLELSRDPYSFLHYTWCLKEAVFKFHRRNVFFKDIRTRAFSDCDPVLLFAELTKDKTNHQHELETLRFGSYFCAYLLQSGIK